MGRGSSPGRIWSALAALVPGRRRRALAEAARRLGLELVASPSAPQCIAGEIEGLPVRVEVQRASIGPARTTVIAVAGIDPSVAIRRETRREKLALASERFMIPSAASQWAKTNDILAGDRDFDGLIDIRGPIPDTLALLSPTVRGLLLEVVDGLGGEVRDGEVRIERLGIVGAASELVHLVRAAHGLAAALHARRARGVLACLCDSARCEPDESIRKTMLATLGQSFPDAPETREISREALHASYDWLRMHGAANLGEEGVPVYRQILADPNQRPAVRGMALRHLGWRFGPAEEELVLGYLHDPAPEIALHAVRILGERAGTARAVEPLGELAGPLTELGRAAADAIEQIQARLDNAEPGQLSLATTPAEGGLSLADGEEGALSPVDDDG